MREAAVDGEDCEKVRSELGAAEKVATTSRQLADAAMRQNNGDPSIYERAGAAAATAQAKREQLGRYEHKKNVRETNARDLRRQIEELRSQLARYAEALDAPQPPARQARVPRSRDRAAQRRPLRAHQQRPDLPRRRRQADLTAPRASRLSTNGN